MTLKLLRAVIATLCLATPLLQAAIPPAENLLPADTLAFFSVPDCAAARAAAKTSPSWMFWGDASMKPFRDALVAKWNGQFIAPLERDLGVNAADFLDLPQGQFTLALTVNGANAHDDTPPGLLLLLDARDKSSSLKTNLAALVKKWSDSGRALRKESIHGLEFTVVPLSSNDFAGILPKKTPVSEIGKEPAKPEKPGEIYFTQFETLLIAGSSSKAVEPVAAHLTGGSAPAIADNAVFAADKVSQFREKPQYLAWFNGKGFFDLVTQAPADDGDADPTSPLGNMAPAKVLGALGLTDIKSISFAMHETHEGSLVTLRITAPESDRSGMVKILAVPPKDASIPTFVPADAVKFSRIRLDGKQAWAELQKIIANLSPSGPALINGAISMANTFGQQKNPGFDLRNDLFGNLNDDIVIYQKAATGNSLAELADPPTLFLVAVSNPDAAINAIKAIGTMSNPQDNPATPRDFLGRKIQSIALRAAPTSAGGGAHPRSLYVSSSGGYVALSTDSSMVEEFLRSAQGQNKPLRENAGLESALGYLGGSGTGMFSYEDHRSDARTGIVMLKTQPAATAAGICEITGLQVSLVNALMLNPGIRNFCTGLDYSLLPDYDAVSKYFYISIFTGAADAGGLTFKFFNPRPPALN